MIAKATCTACGGDFTYDRPDSVAAAVSGFAPRICDVCALDWRAAEELELRHAELQLRNIPRRQWSEGFDTFKPATAAQHKALSATRDHAAEGVLLSGPPGSGKTHLACAAIEAADRGAFFVTACELLSDISASWRPGGGEGLMWRAKSAPLLALDDLGTEATQPWGMAALHALFDHRWNRHLPMIVTTNCSTPVIIERIGQPALSRLRGLCAHRISVKGPDMRGQEREAG